MVSLANISSEVCNQGLVFVGIRHGGGGRQRRRRQRCFTAPGDAGKVSMLEIFPIADSDLAEGVKRPRPGSQLVKAPCARRIIIGAGPHVDLFESLPVFTLVTRCVFSRRAS
jgi:hypothetical protein